MFEWKNIYNHNNVNVFLTLFLLVDVMNLEWQNRDPDVRDAHGQSFATLHKRLQIKDVLK